MPGPVSSLAHGAMSSCASVSSPSSSRTKPTGRSASRDGDVRLQELVADVPAIGRVGEGELALEVLGDDDRRAAPLRLPALRQLADEGRELAHCREGRLRPPGRVRQAEVELEDVVAVRVLVAQAVVVGVVPREPAAGAGEQGRVQHLPVVRGGVLVGREVGRDAELLEDDGLPEAARQLARERGGEQLAQLVVLHRVRVRPDEVDERCEPAERVPVVRARHLDAPGSVAERDRVARPGRPDGLNDDPRPGGDLLHRAGPAVQRHLVRDEPAADRGMVAEAPRDLCGEPGLLGDHPDVAVEVASLPPRRVPVLAGHVADEERRDRAHPGLHMRVEEVAEPRGDVLVDRLGLGDEVGPEAEGARHVEAVRGEHGELLADDGGVVAGPHARPAGARPEVGAEPGERRGVLARVAALRAVRRRHRRARCRHRLRMGRQPITYTVKCQGLVTRLSNRCHVVRRLAPAENVSDRSGARRDAPCCRGASAPRAAPRDRRPRGRRSGRGAGAFRALRTPRCRV